jgi:hypothetical protein
MLIDLNAANEEVVQLIQQTDGRWQYDDYNNPTTDQGDGTGGAPVATTTITSGQQDYQLALTHRVVTRVECKDTNGNWNKLAPFDEHDLGGSSLTDFMKTTGMPTMYDKRGVSINLYPKPNYTQAASLKVYFERPPVAFITADLTDTSKRLGFDPLYHELVPLKMSRRHAIANMETQKAQLFLDDILRIEDNMKEDYEIRSDDDPLFVKAVYRSSR